MNNLKISTRLVLLVGVMAALLLGVGGAGLYGAHQANQGLKTVYEDRMVALGQLEEAKGRILRNQLAISSALALAFVDPEELQRASNDMEANVVAIDKEMAAYLGTYLTPDESAIAERFVAARKRFVAEGIRPAMEALRGSNIDGASQLFIKQVRPLFAPVDAEISALVRLQQDEAGREYEKSDHFFIKLWMFGVTAMVLGLTLAVLMGWVLVRGITQALRQAAEAADAMAHGDMTYPIDTRSQDEVGAVMVSLVTMQTQLGTLVQRVRQGSEGVATASTEIAQGNHDLSARTESQAGSLEETASSMEELSSTVQHNAHSAQQANQLAQTASSVATQGGTVVAEVVQTMHGISDASARISDIIGVIDGIAFQTNILALNAAVEAARAGEQGRGFAVVASEVRALAGRSAEAAREIKGLIGTSSERVAHGRAMADQAGHTMQEVVDSIRRVTDIMREISEASSQQSTGVAQVKEAVSQMDRTTQQNAALVEEMAAAASSLQMQAQELVEVVSVFKVREPGSAIQTSLRLV